MITPEIFADLRGILGDRIDDRAGIREQFGQAETWPETLPPDAVAFPCSTEEVAALLAICSRARVPVIASGARTSLEGHTAAPQGGLAISLTRMDAILAVDTDNLDCFVQAGVSREQLNTHLRATGLFFPIDPGANATLGGMASTRASGTNAVRYGTMAANALGLTVVLPDGRIITTGGRSRKSSAGYDLTHLFVGSEGTLGIITEIRLRLYGIPEEIAAASCAFADIEGAARTVSQMMQLGLPVARVELLDSVQVRACNAYSNLGLPELPHLLLEFHGSPAGNRECAETVAELARQNGGSAFAWSVDAEERGRLWKARHQALYATKALAPGAEVWSSDVCVPIADMPEAIAAVRRDIDANGLLASIVGHVGDGNFHVLFVIPPDDPSKRTPAEAVYARMIDRALAVGGTCTGEHGIGLRKRAYLRKEHGDNAVDVMLAIKRAIDPLGIMNPSKMFA